MLAFLAGLLVGGVAVALVFRKNNAKALAAANLGVAAVEKAAVDLKK